MLTKVKTKIRTCRRGGCPDPRKRDAALAQGYAHLESLLVQRAIEALEGFTPDPDAAVRISEMSMRDALSVLASHRRTIEGGPRSRRQWARPRTLDEVRDSILKKLEAIERARRAEQEESETTGDGGAATPAD